MIGTGSRHCSRNELFRKLAITLDKTVACVFRSSVITAGVVTVTIIIIAVVVVVITQLNEIMRNLPRVNLLLQCAMRQDVSWEQRLAAHGAECVTSLQPRRDDLAFHAIAVPRHDGERHALLGDGAQEFGRDFRSDLLWDAVRRLPLVDLLLELVIANDAGEGQGLARHGALPVVQAEPLDECRAFERVAVARVHGLLHDVQGERADEAIGRRGCTGRCRSGGGVCGWDSRRRGRGGRCRVVRGRE
mmetsp:Transcript_26472/g.74078  ORF Transcript_26472/g.74078 Transcript_26472/m.74078 type:complete len:246 (-) Transcript_26472:210-947(-)